MSSSHNLAASLLDRLRNQARTTGSDYQSSLELFALSRFFARLSASAHKDHFILKGAQLFRIWSSQTHRPTRDADFLGFGNSTPQHLAKTLDAITALTPPDPDALQFLPAIAESIRDENDYGGIRVRVTATLANTRIPLQFDIGFGDVITPDPEQRIWPAILDYPEVLLPTYPLETVIAEKLEAMISLGLANSRMKDFYDLHWLATHYELNLETIREAISNTFQRRNTPLPSATPVAFTESFYLNQSKTNQWKAFLRKNRLTAPPLSEVVHTIKSAFPLTVA